MHGGKKKEKERELLETAPDEMLMFQQYGDEPKKPKSYAGISYKEKMAQLKAKREGKSVPPSQRELQAQQQDQEEDEEIQGTEMQDKEITRSGTIRARRMRKLSMMNFQGWSQDT